MQTSFLTLVKAARLPFLVLTPLCLALAFSLARLQGVEILTSDLLLILLGALLVHVAVNGFNEYFDYKSGLDLMTRKTPFSGGSGALPAQPLASQAVMIMSLACLLSASVIGVWFVRQAGLPLLALCVAAAFISVSYSPLLNRNALACYLAPGVGFGPIMVCAAVLALGAKVDALALLVSSVAGIWTSQLLLMNQVPDEQPDRAVGRRHLVVLWGRSGALEFSLAPLAGALLLILLISSLQNSVWLLLPALPSLGLLVLALRTVHQAVTERTMALNLSLVLMCLISLAIALFMAG